MLFGRSFVAGISMLAGLVAAQSTTLFFTNVPHNVQVGQSYSITYQAPNIAAPVTILLRRGPSGNLQTVTTLSSTAINGVYAWIPSASLPDGGDYALQISQGSQINYSFQFTIMGGGSYPVSPSMPLSTSGTAVTTSSTSSGSLGSLLSSIISNATGHASTYMTQVPSAPYGNATTSLVGPTGTGSGTASTITRGTGTGGTGVHTATTVTGRPTTGTGPPPSGNAIPFHASLGPVAIAMGAVGAVMHML